MGKHENNAVVPKSYNKEEHFDDDVTVEVMKNGK